MQPADLSYSVFGTFAPITATPVGTVISGSVTFPITTWIMWLISMGRRLCRTCVLLRNLQFNHCFSKMTSVLTGMPGTVGPRKSR